MLWRKRVVDAHEGSVRCLRQHPARELILVQVANAVAAGMDYTIRQGDAIPL